MDHDHTQVGKSAEREYKELLKRIEPNILTTKSLKLPRRNFLIEIKPSCSNLKQTQHKPACYPSLRVIDITTRYYTTVIIVANDSCESRGGGSSRRRRDGSTAGGRDGGAIPYFDWDCAPTPVGFGVSQANDSVEGQGESSGRQEGGSGAASVDQGRDGSAGGGGGGDEGGGQGIGGSIDGGGGHGEGNGDEGRGSRGFNVEDGRNSRRTMDISKIAEIFIAVIAQSTAAVIALHYFSCLSSGNRDLLVCVFVTNLVVAWPLSGKAAQGLREFWAG
jgi:hypothetical protein